MPGRKLKVFQAQFGFYDTVVAASSQAAALRAWGTRQDLFAMGAAQVTTEEAAVAAALAQPETPLRRAVGSTDDFALHPTSLPTPPDIPKPPAAKPTPKPRPVAPARAAPDRTRLDDAEKALQILDARRLHDEAKLRREETALAERKQALQVGYVQDRRAAEAQVEEARRAYEAAGGL